MSKPRQRRRPTPTGSPSPSPKPDTSIKPFRTPHYVEVSRSGPIPDAEELEKYNHVIPDGAERIFRQYEMQSDHRRTLESKVIVSDIWRGWVGFGTSAVLDLIFMVFSWDLVRSGHDWGGAALAVTATIHLSFGGISLYTIRRRETNRGKRQKQLKQERYGDNEK